MLAPRGSPRGMAHMKRAGFATTIALSLGIAMAAPSEAITPVVLGVFAIDDQTSRPGQFVAPSDLEATDQFGYSIAASGDTVVVGSRYAKVDSAKVGAAYVYVKGADGTWTQQAKLTPSDPTIGNPASGKRFGQSVAIDGDTIVVGAPYESPGIESVGTAYVFTRSAGLWTQESKLDLPPQVPSGIATSGTPRVCRALKASSFSGLAFPNNARFGGAVAISGDEVVVGAFGAYVVDGEASAGAAYTFKRSGSNWTSTQTLIDVPATKFNQFGESVAISGKHLLVGSPGKPGSSPSSYAGKVTAYEKTDQCGGEFWIRSGDIAIADVPADGRFGASIQVSGDQAVVMAQGLGAQVFPDYPALFRFAHDGTQWTPTSTKPLNGMDPGPLTAFSGTAAVIDETGSVYVGLADLGTGGGAMLYGPETPLTTPYETPLTVAAPGVLVNDFTVDLPLIGFDDLVAVDSTKPKHGTVQLSADGGFTYTPDAGFSGTDTFTYQAGYDPFVSLPGTVMIKVDDPIRKAQTLAPGTVPNKLKQPGKTVLNLANATTEQGRPLRVATKLRPKCPPCAKIVRGEDREAAVRLKGDCGYKLKVIYKAPRTKTLKRFTLEKIYEKKAK